MPGSEWPWALRRPDGERRPKPRLFDPHDQPLPVEDQPASARTRSGQGRSPANNERLYPVEILTPLAFARSFDARVSRS
jgi:hypothetical protein